MLATYDIPLVTLSVVIAIISSLTALNLAGRVTAATDRGRKLWIAGGAVVMGSGIWSLHFIAMLAYKLPIPVAYKGWVVFASLVIAIFVAGLSLYIISHEYLGKLQFWAGGGIMGGAISLMHYVGMAAMQLEAEIIYNRLLVVLSVIVAMVGSYAALWLTFERRFAAIATFWGKSARVFIMSSAIAGMHYIGMSAVCWQATNTSAVGQYSSEHSHLALAIGITTLIMLGIGMQAAFVDRRSKIEASLAESQRRLATLIDSLPGIVFSANNDPYWSMIYLSEGCFNLTGYHSSELVGTQGAYNAITHPEDLANVLQNISTAIANQQPYVVEYRIKTKSGQYKWLWEKGSGVFSDSGALLGLEGFITDITKLKDSQEGLRQAEAKYRSIFENATEGIFQTTTDGKYISANPALARIYGYESPQALIAQLTDINRQLYVVPHRRLEFIRLMQQQGAVLGFESKVYRRDGSVIWISENVRAVKDPNGAAIYYEGTVEDVSDRKQLHEQLEIRVEERTAQLREANYQLQSQIIERQKAEQEVRLLQAMTQAISESPDFHSALGVALQKVCEFTGWSFGEAWIPQGQTLTCSPSWYSSSEKLAEFRTDSQKVTFTFGIGLPGRVWASQQPEWIEDVSAQGDNVCLRASLAKKVGIKAGLGVPIVARSSQDQQPEVLAVLVFFMFESCPENKRQVELVSTVATSLDTLMQRKRAQSALRESEARYRAVVEQTSEGICLIDSETKYILQANAAFERMHAYTSAEIVQLQLYDLVGCDPEIVDSNILLTLQKQHHFIKEVPHRRKDGSLWWAEVNVSCIFYNRRSVLCASVRDISDRKAAELALHSSLATNKALINAIPDLMFRLTREGVYVNFKVPKHSDLLLPPEHFLGKNVYEVMPVEIAEPTMHYIKQAFSSSEVQIFEYQLQLNEKLHDYEARIVVSAENEVMALVRDITERKQLEAEMHHALAKEKELSELKSRFVTTASHEFRTPLTTILSSAELLQKYSFKWSEEKKLQHLERIQTSVKHMTRLLEDVLLIGKVEAEKLEFQPELLDLAQFCSSLVDEIGLITDKHKLVFVCQSDRIMAQMDEKLLRHIFSNLLVNAVKYSPQGGEIKFELAQKQDTAIFHVQDSGIGIPKTEQAKLFDSFHRGSNVGTISGTGLGLAIVKKSVDLHKGAIELESQVNEGTTFIVSLPINYCN